MSDLADLFPGFASHWIDTTAGRLFARSGGSGPPLVCLHGFPQSHVMWHRLAPRLAERFTLILPDLPGYGWSAAPRADAGHAPYTKRAMAAAVVELVEQLGHVRFALVGHDRGARVAHRLVLDHPGRVTRLAVLDIIPTRAMWHGMEMKLAMRVYHWLFLAQPAPLPEQTIGAAPDRWLDATLASWTAAKSLDAFDPRALAHYRTCFRDPSRLSAMCEDYRAGATTDLATDDADFEAGRRITIPLLALWGSAGIPDSAKAAPLDVWRRYADEVCGAPVASGHFLPEENPQDTLAALLPFIGGD